MAFKQIAAMNKYCNQFSLRDFYINFGATGVRRFEYLFIRHTYCIGGYRSDSDHLMDLFSDVFRLK